MKKLWSLLALVLALVLLAGSYVYIKNRPKKDENKNTGENSPVQEQISKLDNDKITKMILSSSKGELVFEKKDKEWIVPGIAYKVDQTKIEDIAASFANMFAEKLVEENPKDLEAYGLKKPSVTAKAVLSDGTEKVFFLGDRSPVGNTYYIMVKDSPKVYTVWMNHGDNFSIVLDQLRDRKLATIEPEEVNYLKIVPEGGRIIEITTTEEGTDGQEFGINLFQMKKPYSKGGYVDTQKMEDLVTKIPNIEIKDFIEDDVKDLSKYGLDKPRLQMEARDKKNNVFNILIGKDKDDNRVYFKTADSKSVYTMEKGIAKNFEVDPFTMVSKFAYIVNIDNVDRIELNQNGKKHTITFSRTVTKKAEKEGEKDEIATVYKIDDKEINEDVFKKFYQVLVGLAVDAEIDKKVPENAEVSTTFYLNKGDKKQVTVKYAPYNENFYAVYRDALTEFVISRDKVNKVFTEIENLIK